MGERWEIRIVERVGGSGEEDGGGVDDMVCYVD